MKFMKKNNMMTMKKSREMMLDLKQAVILEEEISNQNSKSLDLRRMMVFKQISERKLIEINNQDKNQSMKSMRKNFWVKSPLKIFQSL